MEFKHFSHQHELKFKEVDKENDSLCCFGCLDIIYGPAYICKSKTCKEDFAMHKLCAELPPQIPQRDAFHPHPLRFTLWNLIVCDGCGRFSVSTISYTCMYCLFNLDFKCAMALSNDDEHELSNHEAQERRRNKSTIYHFSHNHEMTRCEFSLPKFWATKLKGRNFHCMACKQNPMGTLTYTCTPCLVFIHESCVMPMQVQSSPFHPHHVLLPRVILISDEKIFKCYACREKIDGIRFYCHKCDVDLHVSCAKYQTRAIKHNCHRHPLLHLGKSIISENLRISCDVCRKDCKDSSFRCIECGFNIHLECSPLPPIVKHTRHLHSLVFIDPFVEDDSGYYYCDMCETERNPEHHVYYCEECTFVAHIDCVISEVLEPPEEMFLDRQRMEENSTKEEVSDKVDDERFEFEGMVQNEMIIQKDDLHPHPLTLYNDDPMAMFVCDGCEELCRGSSYRCRLCLFNLDIRCATSKDAKHEVQKVREIKTIINHFSHNHLLTRCKIDISQLQLHVSCMACQQGLICGLIYTCLACKFIIHESCLKDMPMQVRSPFHPQHLLLSFSIQLFKGQSITSSVCNACNEDIKGIGFFCSKCDITLHCSCAKYQTRKIKHYCHDHHLLHLGKSIFVKLSPQCDACNAKCSDTLFGCGECKFYIHLECMPLPYIVKHIRHLHLLTLTNSVVEDDSGKYYCDICETERNSEHDVYYCKECNYIAHIDCVISEVEPPEKIFEYPFPYQKEKPRAARQRKKWIKRHIHK